MANPESAEMLAYLSQLIDATRSGSIRWVRVNPTTFAWDTRTPTPARLVLQRLQRTVIQRMGATRSAGATLPPIETYYVFQALDTGVGEQRTTLNGAENTELNPKLDELYRTIVSTNSRADLEFLKSLLPPVKPS